MTKAHTKKTNDNMSSQTDAAKRKASRAPTKRFQLERLLARPKGAPVSMICTKLGWQRHTVRAAISGLRKSGHSILREPSATSGETVYRIKRPTVAPQGATASPLDAKSKCTGALA